MECKERGGKRFAKFSAPRRVFANFIHSPCPLFSKVGMCGKATHSMHRERERERETLRETHRLLPGDQAPPPRCAWIALLPGAHFCMAPVLKKRPSPPHSAQASEWLRKHKSLFLKKKKVGGAEEKLRISIDLCFFFRLLFPPVTAVSKLAFCLSLSLSVSSYSTE